MRIPLHLSARTLFWLGGIVFSIAGLTLVSEGIKQAAQERAYRKHGEAVEAIVVAKPIRRASREGNSSTRYEIAYRFTTADGRTIEGLEAVGVDEWESVRPGSAFRITYLPGTASSRAAGSSAIGTALLMIGLGTLGAIIGGVFLAITARRIWKERRLLRHGTAAHGIVRAIEPSRIAVNGVRQWIVRYEYRDHHGQQQQGKSVALPPADAAAVATGEAVDIRYDPQRPGESMWVRKPAAAAVGRGTRLKNAAAWLGAVLATLIVGESVPAFKALDQTATAHAFWLTAVTAGMAALGFVLFMGGILYRLFGSESKPISREEVEDLSRSVNIDSRPVAGRVSAYAFRGRSAGASFSEAFSLKEAKQAWQQRAWRTSARWRANFVVSAGALLFTVGLFGFVAVGAPAGIKVLLIAAIVYGAVRLIVAFNRA